jgi:hypothetical protein
MDSVAAAVVTFLSENLDFKPDHSREWPLSWNPSGFLKRSR